MRTNEKNYQLQRVVCRLAALKCSGDLSADEKLDVINILINEGCGVEGFLLLDEKPGRWGYRVDPSTGFYDKNGEEWHWKLRQVRNDPEIGLFERLRATEIDGSTFLGISPGGVEWRAYERHSDADAETMRMRLRLLKERRGIGPVFRA